MRVLRIGTSNDSVGGLPDEQRGWSIAASILADASGEPVETIVKRAWPTEAMAVNIERWVREQQPDMVFLQVSNYWYGHESVPLWFQSRFGRAGKKVADAGLRIGRSKWMTENRFAITANRALVRVLPSATHFSVDQVATAMDAAIRRVLAREGVVLIVRGNDHFAKLPGTTRRANNRNIERNSAMSAAMRRICETHRVPYVQLPTVEEDSLAAILGPAKWHHSAEGERQSGEFDGAAMVGAWQAAGG